MGGASRTSHVRPPSSQPAGGRSQSRLLCAGFQGYFGDQMGERRQPTLLEGSHFLRSEDWALGLGDRGRKWMQGRKARHLPKNQSTWRAPPSPIPSPLPCGPQAWKAAAPGKGATQHRSLTLDPTQLNSLLNALWTKILPPVFLRVLV